MPGSVNDLNRILATHPSILSIGTHDNNALYVRGGNPTENVYIIDGIPFDDINHFPLVNRPGGSFGFIDPDMIKKLDIYAGGSPADLPARTSSAIDIHLRNGKRDRFGGSAELSLTGLGVTGEGPLPASSGSFLMSMRLADLRFIKIINEDIGVPRYGDGLFKGSIDLDRGGELQFHAIGSFDTYRGPPGEPALHFSIDNVAQHKSNVAAGALTWNKSYETLSSSLQLAVSRTEYERARVYTGSEHPLILHYHSDTVYNLPDSTLLAYYESSEFLDAANIYTRGKRKKNFYAKEDFTLHLGEHIEVGSGLSAEMHRIKFHDQYGIQYSSYHYEAPVDSLFTEPRIFIDTNGSYDRYYQVDLKQTAAYLQAAITLGPLTLIPGIRADYFALIDRGGLSPRLGIEFDNNTIGRIALTGSSIRQLPNDFDLMLEYLLRTRDQDEIIVFSDLQLQRCLQASLAYGRPIGKSHMMSIEAYAKRYTRQYKRYSPESRHYTTASVYDMDAMYLRIPLADGGQRTHGCEASFFSTGKHRFFYSASGTWSVSKILYVDNSWYSDWFGECLKGSLLAGFSFSKEHVLTANFLGMTGRWYPRQEDLWIRSGDRLEARFDSPYAGRLDPVYSLSARYTFEHQFKRCTAGGYLEAVNILNKKQVIDRETDSFGYLDHRMLGIIPNAALMLKF